MPRTANPVSFWALTTECFSGVVSRWVMLQIIIQSFIWWTGWVLEKQMDTQGSLQGSWFAAALANWVVNSSNGNHGTFTGTRGVASTCCGRLWVCSSTYLIWVAGTPWTSGLINFTPEDDLWVKGIGEISIITHSHLQHPHVSTALSGTVANTDTFTISDMGSGKFGNGGV